MAANHTLSHICQTLHILLGQ